MSPAWGLIRDKRSHQEDEEDAIASPELFRISITSGNKVTTLFLNQVSAWLRRIAGCPPLNTEGGSFFPMQSAKRSEDGSLYPSFDSDGLYFL